MEKSLPYFLLRFIDRHMTTPPETFEDGVLVYRGSYPDAVSLVPPFGFRIVLDWCNGHNRFVWKSDGDMAILTYCEGDLSLVVCPSRDDYLEECRKCDVYYKTYA